MDSTPAHAMRVPFLGDNISKLRHEDKIADAIVFSGHKQLDVRPLTLKAPQDGDVIVDVHWCGVSTGTERLLWSGEMPPFPGLSYPLVPGYEAVGVIRSNEADMLGESQAVFVPGAHCFEEAAGLFGASAARLIVPVERVVRLDRPAAREDVLLALAATAHHAVQAGEPFELIIGHGVLGRLIARITMALGYPTPTVWETNPTRQSHEDYAVLPPQADPIKSYRSVCDASGNVSAIDDMIAHMGKGATLVLAGFYAERVAFDFPAAFMRELTVRISAEWTPEDMSAVLALRSAGKLSFDGLVTHERLAGDAEDAYATAFENASCLKMALDWRGYHDHTH